MICMSSVPSRIREGMVLLSGDVLLLFNPLQIDYNNVGAAAISFKENVETGKPNGTPRKLLDVSKATNLGWTYKTELEDGIRLAYEDFLNNPMRAER